MTAGKGRSTELMPAGIEERGFEVAVLKPAVRFARPGLLPKQLSSLATCLTSLCSFAWSVRALREVLSLRLTPLFFTSATKLTQTTRVCFAMFRIWSPAMM